MNYLKQFTIILIVSFIGEVLRFIIPLPIPTTIYGLILMLVFLKCKIIKVESVEKASDFLLEIMPVLFISSTVGIISAWEKLQNIFIPVVVISVVSTFVIMIVSGKVTELMIKKSNSKNKNIQNKCLNQSIQQEKTGDEKYESTIC